MKAQNGFRLAALAILAVWLGLTAAGGIFATFKAFLIIGLIAMVVFIVIWFVAGRPRRD